MTDQALRNLQRRAAATGDPADQAAALRARIRSGRIHLLKCPEVDADPLRHAEGVESMTSLRCNLCLGSGKLPAEEALWFLAHAQHPGAATLLGWRRVERRSEPAGKALPWSCCNCLGSDRRFSGTLHGFSCSSRLDCTRTWLYTISDMGAPVELRVRVVAAMAWARMNARDHAAERLLAKPALRAVDRWLRDPTWSNKEVAHEQLGTSPFPRTRYWEAPIHAMHNNWDRATLGIEDALEHAGAEVLRAAALQALTEWLLP